MRQVQTEKNVATTYALPPDLRRKVKIQAAQNGENASRLVARILREALEQSHEPAVQN